MQSILWAAVGTGFTFLMTATGAASVQLKPGSWMCRIPIWLVNTKTWPLC